MADGGWNGPTAVVNGQTIPLIDIKPPASQGAPGYNGGTNASGADIDAIVRTVAAEAGNQSPQGQQAVAHVILNRVKSSGKTPSQVVSEPGQFEGFDNGNAAKVVPNSSIYKTVSDNVAPVLSGQVADSTNGATHFYSPKAQAALGREAPAWAQGQPSAQIGDHNFYNNVQGGQQGNHSSQSNEISDDDLKGATQVVTKGSPGTTASPNEISDEDLAGAQPVNAAPVGNQSPQPQTPGYQKAFQQAQQNPNAIASNVTGALSQVPGIGLAANVPGAQNYVSSALNGFLQHGLPVVQGGTSALSAAISNLLGKIGVGKGAGYSAGEAYKAGRDASQGALSAYGQQHPRLSGVADIGGQIGASALVPELKGAGFLARAGYGAATQGAQGALTGAGTALSQGASPAKIGENALLYGAPAAVLGGPLGEAAHAVPAAFKNPGAKAVASIVGPGALLGGIAGIGTGLQTKDPKKTAAATALGVALGSGVPLARSKAAQKILAEITPADKTAALNKLSEVIGGGNPEMATKVLGSLDGKTTLEAVRPQHRQELMQSAGELNSANLGPSQEVIATRQHPQAVKARLKEAVGEHSTEGNLPEDLHSATGVNPAQAEMNWADNIKQQHLANSELWRNVETEAPVDTPEHTELMKEPVIRQAVKDAQRFLGPRGSAPNPKFNPETAQFKTSENLTDKDLLEIINDGRVSGNSNQNFGIVSDPEKAANYLNEKHGVNTNEPETLPTQAAFITAKRDIAGQVSRDNFGRRLPNHEVSKANGYKNFDIDKLAKQVNKANEQHFEGLAEANKASHEEFGAEEAKEQGFNIGSMGKKAESPEALAERWKDLNSSEQEGLKHGYMQQVYRDARVNPNSAATKYSSDYHKDFQKTLFGEEGAKQFQQSLYNDKIRSAIDKIPIESGNIESSDLKHLENLLTSESEHRLQDKIYGKEKAEQIREAIRQELEHATTGKEIAAFKPNGAKEAEAVKPITSATFGGMGGFGSGLPNMALGAAMGYSGAKAYELAQHASSLIKQGEMTPGARRHLGELLAKPKAEVEAELRQHVAKSRNVKMSDSGLARKAGQAAGLVAGTSVGKVASNAFTGLNN